MMPRASASLMCAGNARRVHLQARDHFQETDGVPQFERAQFVAVAPAHGAIDLDDAIRDFGNHLRAIEEKIAQHLPQETPGAVVGAEQRADALAQVLDVARGVDGRKPRLLERLVFERLPIEHQDLASVALARRFL